MTTVAVADGPGVRPGWPQLTQGSLRSSPLVVPAGPRGEMVLINGSFDGRVYAYYLDGTPVMPGGVLLETGGPIPGSAAWGDVNGDGRREIIIGSFDGHLYLIQLLPGEATSLEIVDVPTTAGAPPRQAAWLVAAQDGTEEDIDGFAARGAAEVSEGEITPPVHVQVRSMMLGGRIYGTPALGQLDGDPAYEIVVGVDDGRVVALKGDGTLLPGWPFVTGAQVFSSAALADLDGDGLDEVYVGSYDGNFYGINANGTQRFVVPTGGTIISSPSIGNIDGGEGREIAFGSSDGFLYVVNAQGQALPGFPLQAAAGQAPGLGGRNDIDASPALVDFNQDGMTDILFGSDGGLIHAVDATGAYLPGFPVQTGGEVFSSPVVVDSDDDGVLELYVGSGDGKLYGLAPDGSALPGFPFQFDIPTTGGLRTDVNATPFIGDLDGDGELELAVGAYDEERLGGRLYLMDLPGSGVLRHDLNLDGVVDALDAFHFARSWRRVSASVSGQLCLGDPLVGLEHATTFADRFHRSLTRCVRLDWPMFRANVRRDGRDVRRGPRAPLQPMATLEVRVVSGIDRATPIVGALIEVVGQGIQTTTNAQGRAQISLAPGPVVLQVSAQGFQPTQLSGVGVANQVVTLPLVVLAPLGEGEAIVTGVVRDAVTGQPIEGALVRLFPGIDMVIGEPLYSAVTQAGGYRFEGIEPGTYTAVGSAPGFSQDRVTVTAVAGQSITQPALLLSPDLAEGQVRIVLSWGETPRDLDAHLTGPLEDDQGRFHVYFAEPGDLEGSPHAALDIDQVGGFGPETITITRLLPGVYRYSVHNFSGGSDPENGDLSNLSNAVVNLFIGETRQTFPVPAGRLGTIWNVFELVVDDQGRIVQQIPLNRFRSGSAGDVTLYQQGNKGAVRILDRLER